MKLFRQSCSIEELQGGLCVCQVRDNFRQVEPEYFRTGTQYAGTLKQIAELSHVAGKVVGHQLLLCVRMKYPRGDLQIVGDLVQEVLRDLWNIGNSLAKGRDLDWNNGKSIIEILPKSSLPDLFPEIAMRGRQYPNVDIARNCRPQADDLSFCQHA